MSVAYETSFTISGATGLTLQPHQILRLLRKIAFQNLREICRKRLKRHLQWRTIRQWSDHESDHDPSMNSSSRTRPFAEVTFRDSETHFVLKNITFRASAIYPNLTEYCACHGKWHCNITKCWACHEKWHCHISNIVRATKSDTEQLLDWAVTSLSCYFPEPHWTVTLLSCYFTELLLYWAVTLLSCYFTEFLLYLTLCIFKPL